MNNRCAFPPDHIWRFMARFGKDSTNPARNQPPQMRTHAETVAAGVYLSFFGIGNRLGDSEKEAYQQGIGVNGFCVFSLVDFFDIIWDFTVDWMHIMDRTWGGGFVPLFKGKNRPSKPRPVQVPPSTVEEPNATRDAKYKNLLRDTRHVEEIKVCNHASTLNVCPMCAQCMPIMSYVLTHYGSVLRDAKHGRYRRNGGRLSTIDRRILHET